MNANAKPILVIGGGIAGITAAVEAAEAGCRVIFVEREAHLGGRVLRMHRYFPKMCPPACGFEINVRRIRGNPRIVVHTLATVEQVQGHAGSFTATIRKRPRYVTCRRSLDDAVAELLGGERVDAFNYGMSTTRALFRPHPMAYPPDHVLDRDALSDDDAATLQRATPPGAIDLEMREEEIRVEVGAIIIATGWRPYDASKLDALGYGRCQNVITNVMLERLAAADGPTGGQILRPSDGERPRDIAFVQCAGSRDDNHLPYCSAVCCMGSLKHARYLREQSAEARISIFYIDIRAVGRAERFYLELLDDPQIAFIKGKVARVEEQAPGGHLRLEVEDTLAGETHTDSFDLVVLATGMVPATEDGALPLELRLDAYGFIDEASQRETRDGIFAAGCARHPCDVSRAARDATGAALMAIQCVGRGR